jgi:hypothetical protein
MEHLSSILWLLSWPVLIYVSYKLCAFTVKVFERNNTDKE